MKRTILAMTLFTIPAWPQAEPPVKPFKYNGNGYTFFSVGTCQHRYTNVGVGGGGEGFIWRGLTIGGEIGYYRFPADRNTGYGVATLGPGYHFVSRKNPAKWDPYVGISVLGLGFAPGGLAAAGSLGGGVNYWFKEKIGLQTGVQIRVIGEEALALFRIGLTFR
ncbi:MAG: hypothetical protein AAB654_02750 [Acidobacteriota bacterium]